MCLLWVGTVLILRTTSIKLDQFQKWINFQNLKKSINVQLSKKFKILLSFLGLFDAKGLSNSFPPNLSHNLFIFLSSLANRRPQYDQNRGRSMLATINFYTICIRFGAYLYFFWIKGFNLRLTNRFLLKLKLSV